MAAQELEKFEDSVRLEKVLLERENQYSPYCDLIYYPSSRDPDLTLAMRIRKPAKPSYIVVDTHGWHMSIPKFKPQDTPQTEYLSIDVDMRGRAFSDGKADCNGWELFDIIDACEYVKKHYREYLIDPDVVYYEGGSGGGGNGYETDSDAGTEGTANTGGGGGGGWGQGHGHAGGSGIVVIRDKR